VRKNLDAYAARHGLLAPQKPAKKPLAPFKGTPKASGHHVYAAEVTGAEDSKGTLNLRVGTAKGTARIPSRYDPKGQPASKFAPVGAVLRVSPYTDRGVDDDGAPREYRLELGPESGLVMVDVTSREILALVGSYEGVRGAFDRATFARRQPGSTFKPIVYAEGIRTRKLTPATVVPLPEALNPNRPLPLPGKDPKDPASLVKPPVFLRDALARSINDAAIWALREVGAPKVVSFAASLGLEAELQPTESLALGAYETTPRDLAAAYLTLASGGVAAKPRLVRKIVGRDGAEVPLSNPPEPRRVLTEAESYVITSLLTSVVERGTGRAAKALGLPLAGKTGTSNDAKDAWFAGYSPTTVCVVWTGYDDALPLGANEQGATAALPAFIDAMRAAHRGRKPAPWKEPAGLVRKRLDRRTGLLAREGADDTVEELFLAGTEPTEVAPAPEDDGAGGGRADGAGGGDAAPPIETPPPPAPEGEKKPARDDERPPAGDAAPP